MHGHTYNSRPDRFSKGKGKIGHSKGSYGSGKKGKSKGKGMGKSTHFYDISALFVPGEIYLTGMVNDTCVVIDTGASENADLCNKVDFNITLIWKIVRYFVLEMVSNHVQLVELT